MIRRLLSRLTLGVALLMPCAALAQGSNPNGPSVPAVEETSSEGPSEFMGYLAMFFIVGILLIVICKSARR